jgi:hypothetical protein
LVNTVASPPPPLSLQPGVGVDGLMAAGKLDKLKNGPVYWVDSADSEPCIGTAGACRARGLYGFALMCAC